MLEKPRLKVYEPLRRAITNKKLSFVQYLLTCTPEERDSMFHVYEAEIRGANILENGVVKEGYEDAYRVYEMMLEERRYRRIII